MLTSDTDKEVEDTLLTGYQTQTKRSKTLCSHLVCHKTLALDAPGLGAVGRRNAGALLHLSKTAQIYNRIG